MKSREIEYNEDKDGNITFRGVIAYCDKPNANGYSYTKEVLENLRDQINKLAETKRAFVSMKAEEKLFLTDVAGLIKSAKIEDDALIIDTIPLRTEAPHIRYQKNEAMFLTMVESKMFGFDMAAMGSVKDNIVQDDVRFISVAPVPLKNFETIKETE